MKYTAVNINEASSSSSDNLTENRTRSRESKTTIKLGCAGAAFAFSINLGILIWILTKFHTSSDGIATVFSGSCSRARSISIWSHLAINILSSALFAASNNCMQYLTAPSRTEVDQAHRRRRRLDVGVHTVRNLRSISRTRAALWACLGLSSLPLHVLYNSAVFEATGASSYTVLTASTEFINGGYWDSTRAQCSSSYNFAIDGLNVHPAIRYLQNNVDSLIRLENTACIKAYGQEFEGKYGNLILVTNVSNSESILNLVWDEFDTEPYTSWICPQSCTANNHTVSAASWFVPGSKAAVPSMCYSEVNDMEYFPVQYCLAQPVPESCQIGVSIGILGVVAACNLMKVFCMYWTFARVHCNPLTTVGDAIASFLDAPDSVTAGFGAMSAEYFESKRTIGLVTGYLWKGKRRFGFNAPSPRRWIICNILFMLFWVLAFLLLRTGNADSDSGTLGFSALAANGIGRLNTEYLIGFDIGDGFTSNVILANTPQVCISFLYLFYNDLFTRIYLSKEWSSYSRTQKPLRVRKPRGVQRSTYFLSLPWRVSVPLLLTMMVLHWLVSQSIFLALVNSSDYGSGGATPLDPVLLPIGCGWSPFAIILSLAVGGAMIIWLWITGFVVQYGNRMPLVRSSSIAISAACHPPSFDADASLKPVMYGVVEGQDDHEIHHVSFTSRPVRHLTPGERYS